LFFAWERDTAARRQAEERAERDGTERDSQQHLAKDDCNCRPSRAAKEGGSFKRESAAD
jgi:hypothetical protein